MAANAGNRVRPGVRRFRSSASGLSSGAATTRQQGYPHGHLGYLAAHEENVLLLFKQAAAEKSLYAPGPPPSHSDETLLRFVRARGWDVEDALRQFADTETWRRSNDIDVLYDTIESEAFEQSRSMYPQWTGRRDNRGIPLYVYEIKSLDSRKLRDYERAGKTSAVSEAHLADNKTSPGLMRLFALYEHLIHFSMPFCTQLQDREFSGGPITLSTNIIDVSGVSFSQFWSLKNHMQAASHLATAHYPEILDRVFVVGAPSFFSTIWGWCKKWFDPVTVSKIFILNPNEVTSILATYIHEDNLPRKYGGTLNWSFGEMPTVDPAWTGVVDWAPGHDSFKVVPSHWEETDDGRRLACIHNCHIDGKPHRELICTIPKTWPSRSDAVVTSNYVADIPMKAVNGSAIGSQTDGQHNPVTSASSKAVEINAAEPQINHLPDPSQQIVQATQTNTEDKRADVTHQVVHNTSPQVSEAVVQHEKNSHVVQDHRTNGIASETSPFQTPFETPSEMAFNASLNEEATPLPPPDIAGKASSGLTNNNGAG